MYPVQIASMPHLHLCILGAASGTRKGKQNPHSKGKEAVESHQVPGSTSGHALWWPLPAALQAQKHVRPSSLNDLSFCWSKNSCSVCFKGHSKCQSAVKTWKHLRRALHVKTRVGRAWNKSQLVKEKFVFNYKYASWDFFSTNESDQTFMASNL